MNYNKNVFSDALLSWYDEHKRNLPWRENKNAYRIWLSEIILQQTRVEQGKPYFEKFIKSFPSVCDLANAEEDKLMSLWQGLGYYTRARNLHKTAKILCFEKGGNFPESFEELKKLPGIGEYTAAAIASIAFDKPSAVVDGNVFRVLSRYYGIDDDISSPSGRRKFSGLANEILPNNRPGDYNQAMMELGAMICKPKNPDCDFCPINKKCFGRKNDRVNDFPVNYKKIKVRKRTLHYLFIEWKDSILVKKRKEKDIWQGLWDFPLLEQEAQPELVELKEKIEPALENAIFKSKTGPFKHKLSHQSLEIYFYHYKLNSVPKRTDQEWVSRGQLKELGKPIILDKFLKGYIFNTLV